MKLWKMNIHGTVFITKLNYISRLKIIFGDFNRNLRISTWYLVHILNILNYSINYIIKQKINTKTINLHKWTKP